MSQSIYINIEKSRPLGSLGQPDNHRCSSSARWQRCSPDRQQSAWPPWPLATGPCSTTLHSQTLRAKSSAAEKTMHTKQHGLRAVCSSTLHIEQAKARRQSTCARTSCHSNYCILERRRHPCYPHHCFCALDASLQHSTHPQATTQSNHHIIPSPLRTSAFAPAGCCSTRRLANRR